MTKFTKNPNYRDLLNTVRDDYHLGTIITSLAQAGRGVAIHELVCKWFYCKEGTQIRVTKEVSDLLRGTDFDKGITAKDIPWPAKALEFVFEDPQLPTILFNTMTYAELNKACDVEIIGNKGDPPENPSYRMHMETGTGEVSFLNVREDQITEYMHGSSFKEAGIDDKTDYVELLGTVTGEEETINRNLLVLCVLACFYIKVHPPITVARKQMRDCKPAVKGRPNRPNLQTVMMPRREYDVHEATDRKNTFKGRRPHFRMLRSEKFTKKQGQIIFVQGIPDPVTGIIPIRKRKISL